MLRWTSLTPMTQLWWRLRSGSMFALRKPFVARRNTIITYCCNVASIVEVSGITVNIDTPIIRNCAIDCCPPPNTHNPHSICPHVVAVRCSGAPDYHFDANWNMVYTPIERKNCICVFFPLPLLLLLLSNEFTIHMCTADQCCEFFEKLIPLELANTSYYV